MGDIVLSVLSLNIRRGWDVTATPGRFTPRLGDQIPIVLEAGWASGLFWKGSDDLGLPSF